MDDCKGGCEGYHIQLAAWPHTREHLRTRDSTGRRQYELPDYSVPVRSLHVRSSRWRNVRNGYRVPVRSVPRDNYYNSYEYRIPDINTRVHALNDDRADT